MNSSTRYATEPSTLFIRSFYDSGKGDQSNSFLAPPSSIDIVSLLMMQFYLQMLKAKPVCALKRHTNIRHMASSSPPSLRAILTHSHKRRTSYLQVRADQSFRDEGTSSNMVDASLRILRERMEEVRNNERLERCYSRSEQGWNYASGYDNYKSERETILSQCFDLIGLIAGTVGLTIVGATSLLCLVSLILHLNQCS